MTFGSDIDLRVLKGEAIGYTKKYTFNFKENKYNSNEKICNKGEVDYSDKSSNIFTNFTNYSLSPPQIIRSDISNLNIKFTEFFDAIICDPPYGKRAFTRKIGHNAKNKNKKVYSFNEKEDSDKNCFENHTKLHINKNDSYENLTDSTLESEHRDEENIIQEIENGRMIRDIEKINMQNNLNIKYAPMQNCTMDQILINLMEISNKNIKKDGYLVYLFPVKISKEKLEYIIFNL